MFRREDEVPIELRQTVQATDDAPTNPKQAFGDKKPDLRLLPLSAKIAQWEAHKDGANKYGEFNWRVSKVEANTYINAAMRHLELFAAGENHARDTGVKNLGAVMACCAILIDAQLHGTMIDNRHKSPDECDMLHLAEDVVQSLKDAQAARDEKQVVHTTAWIKCTGSKPNLYGYRKIKARYAVQTADGIGHYIEKIHDLDHDRLDYGIDWYGVHSWRGVRD